MRRKLGSVVSAIALLAIAAGAAAVNVKMLHGNQAATSVLNVESAADVTPLSDPSPSATSTADTVQTDLSPTSVPTPVSAVQSNGAPSVSATQAPHVPQGIGPANGQGKMAIGSVGAGDGDDDGDGREHAKGDHRNRSDVAQLSPNQIALLRVAALAQVSPLQARDAARGIGATSVINAVKSAATQVGVRLADLAAITELPPEHGRGHGGDDEEHEGDDDD